MDNMLPVLGTCSFTLTKQVCKSITYPVQMYIFLSLSIGRQGGMCLGVLAAVERLSALHYSVDLIFLSFGIMGFTVEL